MTRNSGIVTRRVWRGIIGGIVGAILGGIVAVGVVVLFALVVPDLRRGGFHGTPPAVVFLAPLAGTLGAIVGAILCALRAIRMKVGVTFLPVKA